MHPVSYYHLDVFSTRPLSGNGLTVFPESAGFTARRMQQLTQELRQFETIFLQQAPDTVRARVFTMEEELDFAGHPVLGAAALLHELHRLAEPSAEWTFVLNARTVTVATRREGPAYLAAMNQGAADFGPPLSAADAEDFVRALGLTAAQLAPDLPVQMVSTGLPYLLIPIQYGLERARIGVPNLEEMLAAHGAKFIGVLDEPTRRMRTWDNAGLVEDVATGSLAGPVGAYLVRHGRHPAGQPLHLQQGEFLGRPSQLTVEVQPVPGAAPTVIVSGHACLVAAGTLTPALSETLTTD